MAEFVPSANSELMTYDPGETNRYLSTKVLKSEGQKSVVAFGITGHGKSTFLNFIIRQDRFKTSKGFIGRMKSTTKATECHTTMVEGQQVMLIDTPGFFDSHQIEQSRSQAMEQIYKKEQKQFRLNIMRAFLDAGKEISAFVFVYSPTAPWSLEMTEMINFLEKVEFAWKFCIVVLTHGDYAFRSENEEEKYKTLDDALKTKGELPDQLRDLIIRAEKRVVIVESTRRMDPLYHENVMKRFMGYIDDMEKAYGIFRNPRFAGFQKGYDDVCHKAYMRVLEKKQDLLKTLAAKTVALFKEFASSGNKLMPHQQRVIGFIEAIADMVDKKIITVPVGAAVGFGAAAIAAGIVSAVVGIGLIPVTFGFSTAAVGVGIGAIAGGVATAIGGAGIASTSVLVKKVKNTKEVKEAQKCYDETKVLIDNLYKIYTNIMKVIEKDPLSEEHPEIKHSLFAHLAWTHVYKCEGSIKSEDLLEPAQKLNVYCKLRGQLQMSQKSASNDEPSPITTDANDGEPAPSFALPVGFNLLNSGMDIAHTVGATVEVKQISKQSSKEKDSMLLRTSCLETLTSELGAIRMLCNIPTPPKPQETPKKK